MFQFRFIDPSAFFSETTWAVADGHIPRVLAAIFDVNDDGEKENGAKELWPTNTAPLIVGGVKKNGAFGDN